MTADRSTTSGIAVVAIFELDGKTDSAVAPKNPLGIQQRILNLPSFVE
jgi:hypothetical protein